jgi:hypothetical protein
MGGNPALKPAIMRERRACAGCQAELPLDMLFERDGGWWCSGCLTRTLPPPFPVPPRLTGWRAMLAEIDGRRIAAMSARGAGYIGLVAAMSRLHAEPLAYGVLTGIYSADNVTWIVSRILELPARAATFSLEATIAFLTGVSILAWQGAIIVPQESSALVFSFVTFMPALAAFALVRLLRTGRNEVDP